MFEIKKPLYNPKELLTERWIDFDIMREKPLIFKNGKNILAVMPLTHGDSPRFLKELAAIIIKYYKFFQGISFLNSFDYSSKAKINKILSKLSIYNSTKEYEQFISKAVPDFIKEWGFFVKGGKYYRIKTRFFTSRFIKNLTADELIQMFFSIIVFNYDIVKKKTLDFMKKMEIISPEEMKMKVSRSSSSTGRPTNLYQLPTYSEKPFSKESLKVIEQQSSQNYSENH